MKQVAAGLGVALAVYALATGLAGINAGYGQQWAIELFRTSWFAWSVMTANLLLLSCVLVMFASERR